MTQLKVLFGKKLIVNAFMFGREGDALKIRRQGDALKEVQLEIRISSPRCTVEYI